MLTVSARWDGVYTITVPPVDVLAAGAELFPLPYPAVSVV